MAHSQTQAPDNETPRVQERRISERRTIVDRRAKVRWEPEKPDRRQSYGRRHDDPAPEWQ